MAVARACPGAKLYRSGLLGLAVAGKGALRSDQGRTAGDSGLGLLLGLFTGSSRSYSVLNCACLSIYHVHSERDIASRSRKACATWPKRRLSCAGTNCGRTARSLHLTVTLRDGGVRCSRRRPGLRRFSSTGSGRFRLGARFLRAVGIARAVGRAFKGRLRWRVFRQVGDQPVHFRRTRRGSLFLLPLQEVKRAAVDKNEMRDPAVFGVSSRAPVHGTVSRASLLQY